MPIVDVEGQKLAEVNGDEDSKSRERKSKQIPGALYKKADK